MLHGRHAHIALSEHRSALCVDHMLGNGIDDRHSFKVYALYLVTIVLRSRVERHGEAQTCMQTLSTERKAAF